MVGSFQRYGARRSRGPVSCRSDDTSSASHYDTALRLSEIHQMDGRYRYRLPELNVQFTINPSMRI